MSPLSVSDKMHMEKENRLRDAFFERLMLAAARAGLSKADIARGVWASESTIGDWFRPHVKALPEGIKMAQLPAILGVNGHWLLTGEGRMTDQPLEGADAGEAMARVQRALDAVREEIQPAARRRGLAVEASVARKRGEAANGRHEPPKPRKSGGHRK